MSIRVIVCTSCHKLRKFCRCPDGAVARCPICLRPRADGPHFPETDDCRKTVST